jgi:hypothetical protein
MVYERQEHILKKGKRIKIQISLCTIHNHSIEKLKTGYLLRQLEYSRSGCNIIRHNGLQCGKPGNYKTDSTLYMPVSKSAKIYSIRRYNRFLKSQNLTTYQFENFIRFYVLMLQHAEELLGDRVDILIEHIYNIDKGETVLIAKFKANFSYYVEKINSYFKLSTVEEFDTIISQLKETDLFSFFQINFFERLHINVNITSEFKIYIAFIMTMRLILLESSKKEKNYDFFLVSPFGFQQLKKMFNAFSFSIQNTSEKENRIHSLLEIKTDLICRSIVFKSFSENESVDNLKW